jgi:hypothetical protein
MNDKIHQHIKISSNIEHKPSQAQGASSTMVEIFKSESADADLDAMAHETTKLLDDAGEHIEPCMRKVLDDLDDMLDAAEEGYESDASSSKLSLLDRFICLVVA